MSELHNPVPGYWYINGAGKLMRVRFVAYVGKQAAAVLIQYIEGVTQTISIEDWHHLDLVVPRPERSTLLRESEQGL